MRTIIFNFNHSEIMAGLFAFDKQETEFNRMLTRLATYGGEGFKTVEISLDGLQPDNLLNPDSMPSFIAVYKRDESESDWPNFVIGAIWRKDTQEYSFHS